MTQIYYWKHSNKKKKYNITFSDVCLVQKPWIICSVYPGLLLGPLSDIMNIISSVN